MDFCIGELDFEDCQQLQQGCFLPWRACVGWLAATHAADVAHSYGCGVVVVAVCSDVADGASGGYGAVEVYDVVIAYAAKAHDAVPAVYVGNGEVASLLRCRAVYYDFAYGSHFCMRLMTFT